MARRTTSSGRKSRLAPNRPEPRRPNRRRRRQRPERSGSLPLAVVFTVLVGINIYVFFFRGGTSIQDLMQASALQKESGSAGPLGPSAPAMSKRASKSGVRAPAPLAKGPAVVHGSMRGYLGLSTALAAFGVERADAAELIAALRHQLNMRALTPTQRFDIVFDSRTGRVKRLTYHLSASARVVAERDARGVVRTRREPRSQPSP